MIAITFLKNIPFALSEATHKTISVAQQKAASWDVVLKSILIEAQNGLPLLAGNVWSPKTLSAFLFPQFDDKIPNSIKMLKNIFFSWLVIVRPSCFCMMAF